MSDVFQNIAIVTIWQLFIWKVLDKKGQNSISVINTLHLANDMNDMKSIM